jgi:tetratricopeptide (TPR) repeat protein
MKSKPSLNRVFALSESEWTEAVTDDFDESDEAIDESTGETGSDALPTQIAGKRIALAGKLGGMNRREASNLLRSYAATVVDLDASAIDMVVIGAEESPLSEADLLSSQLREAAASGRLEVIAETELWQRLGLVDIERSIKRFYTPAMLADLLGVSVRVIRRWHRRGLIVPARTMHKLPYFDFQEVATARRLAELVAAGASPQAIEDRLRELAEVLPEVTRPLAQLSVLVEGRHVLLRQGEGLIEPGGQLRFDFAATDSDIEDETTRENQEIFSFTEQVQRRQDASQLRTGIDSLGDLPPEYSHPYASPFLPGDEAIDDDLLQAMYDAEDRGDLTLAMDYGRAILARDGLRADICFQLGELLYRDGQVEAARERYFCAIELDEAFVEARTSLACVLAETGRHDLAIAALQGVLSLHEDYPDAHYHLATLYDEMGQHDEAAQHWETLRRLAPDSQWNQPPAIDEE